MMFGTRERFTYFQCLECACLQIAAIPEDLARHYPPDYYGLDDDPRVPLGFVPEWCHTMLGSALPPELLQADYPHERARDQALARRALDHYFPGGLPLETRILDVGCGSGTFLAALRSLGFEQLLGVDAFLKADIEPGGGVRVMKGSICRVDPASRWDLIMFHHSFEHLPEQQQALREAARRLEEGGTCLLRVPTVAQAWEEYGVNWVQLDPPRHLYLHSPDSLRRLAGECGFALAEVRYDSTSFQFWGSEQYARDISLYSPRSYAVQPSRSPFTPAQMAEFARRAAKLNQRGRGDQAAFYLRRL